MNTKTRSTKTGALPAFLTRDPYITRLVLVLVLLLAFFAFGGRFGLGRLGCRFGRGGLPAWLGLWVDA